MIYCFWKSNLCFPAIVLTTNDVYKHVNEALFVTQRSEIQPVTQYLSVKERLSKLSTANTEHSTTTLRPSTLLPTCNTWYTQDTQLVSIMQQPKFMLEHTTGAAKTTYIRIYFH